MQFFANHRMKENRESRLIYLSAFPLACGEAVV